MRQRWAYSENALDKEDRFVPEAFQNRKNFFTGRNVTAIVLEIPSQLIGRGQMRAWATVSLYGHAPEVQVSRWGLPLLTNIFMPEMDMREDYNRAVPLFRLMMRPASPRKSRRSSKRLQSLQALRPIRLTMRKS